MLSDSENRGRWQRRAELKPHRHMSVSLLGFWGERIPVTDTEAFANGALAWYLSWCEYISIAFIPLASSLALLYFPTLINETSCRYYLSCIDPELMKQYKGSFLFTRGVLDTVREREERGRGGRFGTPGACACQDNAALRQSCLEQMWITSGSWNQIAPA